MNPDPANPDPANPGSVNPSPANPDPVNPSPEVDWPALREAAVTAAGLAYCPYSGLAVGAAGLGGDGQVVCGCNVENVSYGLSLCAECILVGQLRLAGAGSLRAVACRAGTGELLMPCGRCRQLLYEAGGERCLVDTPAGVRPLGELLPEAFGEAGAFGSAEAFG